MPFSFLNIFGGESEKDKRNREYRVLVNKKDEKIKEINDKLRVNNSEENREKLQAELNKDYLGFREKMAAHAQKYEPDWLKDIKKVEKDSFGLKGEADLEAENLESGDIKTEENLDEAKKRKLGLTGKIKKLKETVRQHKQMNATRERNLQNKKANASSQQDKDDLVQDGYYTKEAGKSLSNSEQNLERADEILQNKFEVEKLGKEDLIKYALKAKFKKFKGSDVQKLLIHARNLHDGTANSNQEEQVGDKASKGADAKIKEVLEATPKSDIVEKVSDVIDAIKNVIEGLKGLYDAFWGTDSEEEGFAKLGSVAASGATVVEGVLSALGNIEGLDTLGPIGGLIGNTKNIIEACFKLRDMSKSKSRIETRRKELKKKIAGYIEYKKAAAGEKIDEKAIEKEADARANGGTVFGQGRERRVLDFFKAKGADEKYERAEKMPGDKLANRGRVTQEFSEKYSSNVRAGWERNNDYVFDDYLKNKDKQGKLDPQVVEFCEGRINAAQLQADELAELMNRQDNIKRARIKDIVVEAVNAVENIASFIPSVGGVIEVGAKVAVEGGTAIYETVSGIGEFIKNVTNSDRSGQNKKKFRTTYATHMYDDAIEPLFDYAEVENEKDSKVESLIEQDVSYQLYVLNRMVRLETNLALMGVSVDDMTKTRSKGELIEKMSEAFGVAEGA